MICSIPRYPIAYGFWTISASTFPFSSIPMDFTLLSNATTCVRSPAPSASTASPTPSVVHSLNVTITLICGLSSNILSVPSLASVIVDFTLMDAVIFARSSLRTVSRNPFSRSCPFSVLLSKFTIPIFRFSAGLPSTSSPAIHPAS